MSFCLPSARQQDLYGQQRQAKRKARSGESVRTPACGPFGCEIRILHSDDAFELPLLQEIVLDVPTEDLRHSFYNSLLPIAVRFLREVVIGMVEVRQRGS